MHFPVAVDSSLSVGFTLRVEPKAMLFFPTS